MPQKIKRPFCTMFRMSETEVKMRDAAAELEAQREEIDELKKQIAELLKNNTSETGKKKSTRSGNKDTK